jgi:hypothetical protein
MNEQPFNKLNPSTDDWLELLDALRGEARAGRLRSLTFMLQQGTNRDRCIVDHAGAHDVTEIACRKTVEAIADAVESTNVALARAIRAGMPQEGIKT